MLHEATCWCCFRALVLTTLVLAQQDVIIASGGSGALDIALTGFLNPGDNILLPKPGFPLYQVICETHRIECKFYNLDVRSRIVLFAPSSLPIA